MKDSIHSMPNGGMSFTGKGVDVYRATVIGTALRTYARCGMIMNRAYTPKAMMAAAMEITGKKFKARDYTGAADALSEFAHRVAADIHANAAKEA